MPTWDKILQEVDEQLNSLRILEKYIEQLHQHTKRTVICYMSAFSIIKPPVPSPFHSIIDQDIQGFMTCAKDTDKNSLDLIIHTPGGDYEATKRIFWKKEIAGERMMKRSRSLQNSSTGGKSRYLMARVYHWKKQRNLALTLRICTLTRSLKIASFPSIIQR